MTGNQQPISLSQRLRCQAGVFGQRWKTIRAHEGDFIQEPKEDSHLVVAVAGYPDGGLLHLHVHHQPFHHRQCVLVVPEVLQQ